MRKLLSFALVVINIYAFGQFSLAGNKKRKKPITEINHKFNRIISTRIDAVTPKIPGLRTCLTTEHNLALSQQYNLPSVKEFESEFKILKSNFVNNHSSARTAQEIITIPVIVHVIHNGESIGTGANISSAQVQSQIEVLNEDFGRLAGTPGFNSHPDGADVEIRFALALRDEFGNTLAEPGIHRVNGNSEFWAYNEIETVIKPQTVWDSHNYLNIWTVNFGGEDISLLGYAQFPNLSGLNGLESNNGLANTDGVVIGDRYFGREGDLAENFDGGRTTTHEIGHWLGLRHVWGDGDCEVDDFCDDTPNASGPNYRCPVGTNSCNDGPDMIENYMDYTDDACMNIFTEDQKVRMQTVMTTSPRRKELLNSTVHLSVQSPIAYFGSNKTEICAGESIDFTDESINSPDSWQWTFTDVEGAVVGAFTDENPSLIFNGSGIYDLSLVVENSFGSDSLYSSNYVTVLSSDELVLPFNEDFEFLNALDKWIYYNPDNDRTWQETSDASSQSGSWSVYFDNYSSVDGDPSGTVDALFSPNIDLSTNEDVYLTFDVAYAMYASGYSDTLAVFISTDCGSDFIPIWSKGGEDLATAPNNLESYFPNNNSEWVTERIPLQDFNGNANVHIAIVNISGWGNNMFLDNISILKPSYSTASNSLWYTPRDTVSVGTTVNFWDYSTEFPTTWFWELEGATPATSDKQNPTVEYTEVGTFDVQLTTSNSSGGTVSLGTDYITVIEKPNVALESSSTNNTICIGDSIRLIASGTDYFEWYDERGYLISINDTLVAYPQITTTFELIGYDNYGGSTSVELEVIVNPLPEFSLGSDLEIYDNEIIILDVVETFASYLWNDNSTNKTDSVIGNELGVGEHEFYVHVTDDFGCTNSDTINVRILEYLDLTVSSNVSDNAICEGESALLVASGVNQYKWKDESGVLLSDNDSLEVSPNESTIYEVIGFGVHGDSISIDIEIAVNPNPEFDLGEDLIIYEDESVTLDAGDNFISYLWNNNSTSRTNSVNGNELGVGVHEVFVKVTDGFGCTSSDTIVVTVLELLELTVTSNASANEICEGETALLVASGVNQYKWKDENGVLISDNDSLVVSPDENTIYEVIGFGVYGDSISTDIEIVVNPNPVFDLGGDVIINEDEFVTLDVGENFISYLWNDGVTTKTREISGSQFDIGTYEFHVTVIDENNCQSADTVIVIIEAIPLGFEIGNQIEVYPIPSEDHVILKLPNIYKSVKLHLFDVRGKLLINQNITSNSPVIDVSKLPKGVYMLKLNGDEGGKTVKIIIN